MLRDSGAFLLLILLVPGALALAASPEQPSGPGPEHKRLGSLIGTWQFSLTLEPSPLGPGGPITGTDHNEWLPGGYFLVRRYETRSPLGEFRGLEVIGYDAAQKVYLQHGFDSRGSSHAVYRGTVEKDTWTWTFDTTAEGQAYQVRVTIREVSPTLQRYQAEISRDGRAWTSLLQGILTKTD